jgi:hypothetical protein
MVAQFLGSSVGVAAATGIAAEWVSSQHLERMNHLAALQGGPTSISSL